MPRFNAAQANANLIYGLASNARHANRDHVIGGGEMVAQSLTPSSYLENPDTSIRCDIELGRICVGLRQSAQLRLWLIIEEYARETNLNHLTRQQLTELLQRFQVKYSEQNLSKWLWRGHGLYWNLHGDTVWLIGYERLSKAVVNLAATRKTKRGKSLQNLIITNTPGMKRAMYVTVASQNLHEFESNIYAAWHASKDGMPISRYTLTRLWNRDVKTLIRYQRTAKMIVLNTFVHYTEATSNHVPLSPSGTEHRGGVIEYEVGKHKRWSAEYSNTYRTTTAIRQHPVRGKSRRVFAVVRNLIESGESVGTIARGGNPDGLIRTGRLVHADTRLARSKRNRDKDVMLLDKGIDNSRCRHLECTPDGKEHVRLNSCVRAFIPPKGNKCMESRNDPF